MRTDLFSLVCDHDEIADLDPAARRLALRSILATTDVADVAGSIDEIADEIDGYGPITRLMEQSSATDVFINGPFDVRAEIDGEIVACDERFLSHEHLTSWCEMTVARAGGRVDMASPIADVRLRDGSRMHVVLPPVASDGPVVSIRRFPREPITLEHLVARRTMTEAQATMLSGCVANGDSIVVSGSTGAGKTTLLGALLALVPQEQRVVVIEELPELRRGAINHVHLVARAPNPEGKGAVQLSELVRASLRMRPDRIVVGEVRGPEALAALWAMRTGHSGATLSVHADSVEDARRRLVDLALMSAWAPSERSLEAEVEAAIDVFVHMTRVGGRKVAGIATRA